MLSSESNSLLLLDDILEKLRKWECLLFNTKNAIGGPSSLYVIIGNVK